MKTLALNANRAGRAALAAALFLAIPALPELALAQTPDATAENPHVATEGDIDHSGMHAMAPLDLSDNAEIDESASVISPDSTTSVTVSSFQFTPATVTVAQGDTVRWDFPDSTTHTATDTTAMGLFDSGNKSSGGSFPFVFNSAGTYPYHCQIHSSMQGKVQIPIKVAPATGTATTGYTITWSSIPAPTGFVFDIQIKRPGARSFVNWKMGLAKRMVGFTPGAGPGNYSFRARLRKLNNGAHSLYSPFRTITVQ